MTKVFVIVNTFDAASAAPYLPMTDAAPSASGGLDEALAAYLEWERADYREAVEGIRQGYEDVKAGRTRPGESQVAGEPGLRWFQWLRCTAFFSSSKAVHQAALRAAKKAGLGGRLQAHGAAPRRPVPTDLEVCPPTSLATPGR
jgi:hypothetical protein